MKTNRILHGFLVFSILLIALAISFSGTLAGKPEVKRGSTPPDVRWATVAGDTLSWDQLRGGGPLVAFFWATWCKVCKKTIPRLIELAESYENRTHAPAWASISLGEPPDKVLEVAQAMKLPRPWIADPEEANGKTLGINYVPTICVLDRKGEVVYWGKSDMKKLDHILEELTGEPVSREESRK